MTKSIGMIVAGVVGPTETRLALCGLDVGRPIVVAQETSPNDRFEGLAPMVQRFLQKYRPPQIRAGAFIARGPIHGGVSLATDLPWAISGQAVAAQLALDHVTILSEAEGVAHAIPALPPEELLTINAGDPGNNGNQVVIAASAGPSVAGLYWDGTEHRPFASDADHADFAPSGAEDVRLASYAAFAANLALTLRATGGIYLAGDIVPVLRETSSGDAFVEAFCRRSAPMDEALRRVPIHAVTNPQAALLGAATVAARSLRTTRGGGWAS